MSLRGTYQTLENVAIDEPIFVLRGQDVIAPMIVERWASLARKLGVNSKTVGEAYKCASEMRNYRIRKLPD